MTLIEISALVQSGVLSALAVVLAFKTPAIWTAYLAFVEARRTFEADQSYLERKFRNELSNRVTASLAELTIVVGELRDAASNMCKFKA